MLITVILIVIAAAAYCLGSINGAIVISRFVYHEDVRNGGSGNAGLTNFYRIYGPKAMAGVVGIDVAKGLLAALIGGWLLGLTDPGGTGVDFAAVGRLFGTFCVVMGHVFPAFYGFRGGKGVLCGVSAAFVVDWRAGLICVVVFLIIFFATKYVSLGSILGALSFPITLFAVDYRGIALILAIIPVLVIVLKHGGNINRLIYHKEPKFKFQKDLSRKLDEDDF